jgi:hypothetical protein
MDLVATATRLDDNFRKKSQKNKENYKNTYFQQRKSKRYPDEMDWKANKAFKKKKKKFRKTGQKKINAILKKKKKCFNYSKKGYFVKEYRSAKANNARSEK